MGYGGTILIPRSSYGERIKLQFNEWRDTFGKPWSIFTAVKLSYVALWRFLPSLQRPLTAAFPELDEASPGPHILFLLRSILLYPPLCSNISRMVCPFSVSDQNFVRISRLPHTCCMPHELHPSLIRPSWTEQIVTEIFFRGNLLCCCGNGYKMYD